MKTTVKLGQGRAIVVQPAADGRVRVDVTVMGVVVAGHTLTPDQWGALSLGGDEALKRAQERQGAAL